MRSADCIRVFVLVAVASFCIPMRASGPKPPKERVLLACPDSNHYVELGRKRIKSVEDACKTFPPVQPLSSDLVWIVGKIDLKAGSK